MKKIYFFEKEKMGGIRRIWFLGLLIAVTLFVREASALPVGDRWLYDSLSDVVFNIGSGSAEVDCEVYKYTSGVYEGKYVYTCRISNIDSEIGLSFFSVGILDGANAFDADFEPLLGVANPDLWAVVGSPAQSVDGLFSSPIYSDGPITTSTVLWFVSDDPPHFRKWHIVRHSIRHSSLRGRRDTYTDSRAGNLCLVWDRCTADSYSEKAVCLDGFEIKAIGVIGLTGFGENEQ